MFRYFFSNKFNIILHYYTHTRIINNKLWLRYLRVRGENTKKKTYPPITRNAKYIFLFLHKSLGIQIYFKFCFRTLRLMRAYNIIVWLSRVQIYYFF